MREISMKTKFIFTTAIACTCLLGCSSTSNTKNAENIVNLPGYVLNQKKITADNIFLNYEFQNPYMFAKADIEYLNLFEWKPHTIQGAISQEDKLQKLPITLEENSKNLINNFETELNKSGDKKVAFKTCDVLLSTDINRVEVCSYDYKFRFENKGTITTSDTERVFYISTFYSGKLSFIIMHNYPDFRNAYLAMKNLYQLYKYPIILPPYETFFGNINMDDIKHSYAKHDKKIYTPTNNLPKNFQSQIKELAFTRFKDPNSVIYKFDVAKPLKMSDYKTDGRLIVEYCFLTNAKNEIGGYTGYKLHKAFFINNKLENYVLELAYNSKDLITQFCELDR